MTDTKLLALGEKIRPTYDFDTVKKLVSKLYGFSNLKVKELESYDDNNFYIELAEGDDVRKFIFKVLNSHDSKNPAHTEAQNKSLFHLDKLGYKCSVPQLTLEGESLVEITKSYSVENVIDVEKNENGFIPDIQTLNIDGDKGVVNVVRLLSFVPGETFAQLPKSRITKELFFNAGVCSAKLQQDLKDCHHPALKNHETIWMISNVVHLDRYIYVLKVPERVKMITEIIEAFKQNVVTKYDQLEKGVIHADFNEQNVVVDGDEIGGIIDFGDMHESYYVLDIAMTAMYLALDAYGKGVEDLMNIAHLLNGYNSVRKISPLEWNLMRTCMAARLCQSLVLGEYTYSLDPGNEYLLTTAKAGWKFLNLLWNELTDSQLYDNFLSLSND